VARTFSPDIDVNQANRYGVAPLSIACQTGNAKLIARLLDAGANPNTTLPGGETALMTAAKVGRIEAIDLLLKKGAKLEAANGSGQSALAIAAFEGHTEAVERLLKADAKIDRKTKRGFTPLMFAARAGHAETVNALINGDADVNDAHYDLAMRLVRAGADPNDDASAFNPLHVLTWVRKPHRGEGKDGLPPPKGSGAMSSLEFATALIEAGAKVDSKVKDGSFKQQTAFLMAARRADLAYMKLLHELGANPLVKDTSSNTAFLSAAGIGSDWLLELGHDINDLNKSNESPMHGAAYKNAPVMVDWLVEKGIKADRWNRKNKHGWTPLAIARGYRPGNFKPDVATELAIIRVMENADLDVPPAPVRLPAGTDPNEKKGYRP